MTQITFDDLLTVDPVRAPPLLLCSLTKGYHWIRIPHGHTPSHFTGLVDFKLGGYDHLYRNTYSKDELLSEFHGPIKEVSYLGDGKG